MQTPSSLFYSAQHLWAKPLADGVWEAGITDYAQDLLGDIVFVDAPAVGSTLKAGQACGLVESVKTGSDLHALVEMVNAAYHYPEIRQVSTLPSQEVTLYGRQSPLNFVNTNALVRGGNWTIGLSKTGFINEAGRCLVMQAEISGQPTIIVLLDSAGKMTRIGDANRIRKWVERNDANSLGEHVHG